MRRTYRSKKDTTSVIERRDLFQNLDDNSTAYDAFSIQNIKQTKRELSCVGSFNSQDFASSKVRKKKLVKRKVKDAEIPHRDSTSSSGYLTPDRSIRVNKPLDPFDLLLMSSPACPVETTVKQVESVTNKVCLLDKLVSKKEGRSYSRCKPKKAITLKSFSTDSSDSDKENSDEKLNIRKNTSDIRAHKLLVEKVVNISPKVTDDSINNIVNNLSLMNKLKPKYSANDSANKSLIPNRHRLTKNILSPLSQKSPLCSTPFKVKYRGDSIFKYSPIKATKEINIPQHASLTEDNDESNCSVLLLGNVKESSPNIHEEKELNLSPQKNTEDNRSNEVLYTEEVSYEAKTLSQKMQKVPNSVTNSNLLSNLEISSLQHTELEPFLGFSTDIDSEKVHNLDLDKSDVIVEDRGDDVYSERKIENIDTVPDCNNGEIDIVDNNHSYEDSIHNVSDNDDDANDDSFSSETEDDNGSLYDTCTSEQSSVLSKQVEQESLLLLERMDNSTFFKYYDKMKYEKTNSDEIDSNINSESGSFEDYTDLKTSSLSSSNIESDAEEYISDNKTDYNNDEIESKDDEEYGSNNEEEKALKTSSLSSSNIESDAEEYISDNKSDYNNDEIESKDDEEYGSNNEEEKAISFVTTRRRNEIANNSIISMFNDSNDSSNTDCDNTVLSNQITILKPDALMDINDKQTEEDDEMMDLNKDSDYLDQTTVEQETKMSFITNRNSSVRNRKSSIWARKSSLKPERDKVSIGRFNLSRESIREESRVSCFDGKPTIVLQPGKKWERSLSIYRRMTMMADHFDKSILDEESNEAKGRRYRQSVINTMEMQEFNSSLHNESINSRRSTFVSKPCRSTIRIVKDPNLSRLSLCNTSLFDDIQGFLNEECDDTIIELSKLSITDQTHEVTVIDNFHDNSNRIVTAKDYVLRRCNQTEPILFDECYPDSLLKNCHKIGEGVYGEVFLWRARDGHARVLKIVPIAGNIKVNGESQKDFHEIISEIVIAMELSALRAPIAEIERHFDEEKDVETLDLHAIENATDVFNEVLAVRCVYGSYPSRLLDLWDLYDECKGSENDNPAILPVDQQYIVLELANAGQDLESYQFNNAEQAHALFLQVAYGLAVAEEAFQFEHRDLHWGNVLIAPTEQKFATFVLRGRLFRVARCGVSATVIDYSLSRVALRLGPARGDAAALYNDLAADESLFDAVGDYQFQVYRLMRDKLGNDWKNYEPYTNILWLHYTVDKMITALRYKRTNTKIHKHYIDKLKGIKNRILDYGSAVQFVLTDNEI